MRRRGLLDRMRWHTITGDVDYAAAGDRAYIHVHRGRWRRPVEIQAPRDELVNLAECIVDGEVETVHCSHAWYSHVYEAANAGVPPDRHTCVNWHASHTGLHRCCCGNTDPEDDR